MKSFCGWVGAIGFIGALVLIAFAFYARPVWRPEIAVYAGFTFGFSVVIGALGEIIDLLTQIRDRLTACSAGRSPT